MRIRKPLSLLLLASFGVLGQAQAQERAPSYLAVPADGVSSVGNDGRTLYRGRGSQALDSEGMVEVYPDGFSPKYATDPATVIPAQASAGPDPVVVEVDRIGRPGTDPDGRVLRRMPSAPGEPTQDLYSEDMVEVQADGFSPEYGVDAATVIPAGAASGPEPVVIEVDRVSQPDAHPESRIFRQVSGMPPPPGMTPQVPAQERIYRSQGPGQ
ncbi:hypothetical protein [Motiliproteus sp. SC1-56]|uniref:hypothetical protein n=1 Tax=Motiliproteus sp. SC1-56 TaxID=2799565 RepID=UPI001A8C57AB|nr:hypothetical protein [Motiliproteus sp. SC1-56]